MRILVVSDSHGRWGALSNAIMAQPTAEVVIHLGDGSDDLERLRSYYPERMMVGVSGNCDYYGGDRYPAENVLRFAGKSIFYTHGHTYRVKSGDSLVEQAARARGADICLYGHTHTAMSTYRDGLYIMNPGSIAHPRGDGPTCGIIDITDAGVVVYTTELK